MSSTVNKSFSNILKIVGTNILVLVVLVLVIEAGLQLVALARPSYHVLFLQPDRVLGWKQVPNARWNWAGHYWYASDFNVEIETNSLGFRDKERELRKPDGIRRIGLLGDSFIEAVQVPFDLTASQLLEKRLNNSTVQNQEPGESWEVFNFGVSNFGVGQYLLTWEQYAKQFQLDYVAIFVANLHMKRTMSKYEYGAFSGTQDSKMWVRPTFRIENGDLIREPAKDFDRFEKVQEDLILHEFDGSRSRKRTQLITPIYFSYFTRYLDSLVTRVEQRFLEKTPQSNLPNVADMDERERLIITNEEIIKELGLQVKNAGGRLILLDLSRYFGDDESVTSAFKKLSEQQGFGYVSVYDDLLTANRDGISTRWPHDNHLNHAGNQILADSIFDSIK